MKKRKLEGHHFYKGAGLEKQILVHVSKQLHSKLLQLAKDQSLEKTVRAILERRVK